MTVYFSNFDCPLSADDPAPLSSSQGSAGKTGSLPNTASFDGQWAQSQVTLPSIVPNQKPGSEGGFNRGMN